LLSLTFSLHNLWIFIKLDIDVIIWILD